MQLKCVSENKNISNKMSLFCERDLLRKYGAKIENQTTLWWGGGAKKSRFGRLYIFTIFEMSLFYVIFLLKRRVLVFLYCLSPTEWTPGIAKNSEVPAERRGVLVVASSPIVVGP